MSTDNNSTPNTDDTVIDAVIVEEHDWRPAPQAPPPVHRVHARPIDPYTEPIPHLYPRATPRPTEPVVPQPVAPSRARRAGTIFAVLAAVLVLIGILIVGLSRSGVTSSDPVSTVAAPSPGGEVDLVLTLSGTGTAYATVTITEEDGVSQRNPVGMVSLPWSQEVTVPVGASVGVASSASSEGATTCSITHHGTEAIQDGPDSVVVCLLNTGVITP